MSERVKKAAPPDVRKKATDLVEKLVTKMTHDALVELETQLFPASTSPSQIPTVETSATVPVPAAVVVPTQTDFVPTNVVPLPT